MSRARANTAEMRPVKRPMRTCAACGKQDVKGTLVRFVSTKDGALFLDESGRADGRGAYICPDPACFTTARKRHSLDRVLKRTLTEAEYDTLEVAFRQLCEGDAEAR